MNSTLQYLFNYAFSNKIGVTVTNNLSPTTPSMSRSSNQTILINLNWHNQNEIPFIFAHEIAHLLNNDVGILYYTSSNSRSKIETSANIKAIEILTNYSEILGFEITNPITFMESFGIPLKFEDLVINQLEKSPININ